MSYRDINRGPQLNKEYEAYQAWLKKTAEQKQTAYKAVAKPKTDRVRPGKVDAYVRPFLLAKDNVFYRCRGLAETQTGAGAELGAIARTLAGTRIVYVSPNAPADTVIDKLTRYRFAKITVSRRTGTGDENAKSRITNRPYTRYKTDNVSTPFGRTASDVNFQAVVDDIRKTTAYTNFVKVTGSRVGFTPEG